MRTRRIASMAVVAATAAAGALGTALPATASTVRPAITAEGCSESSPANWARVELTNGGWECWGYTGQTPYEAFDANDFWAGNNFGTITFNWDYSNHTTCFGVLSNWVAAYGALPSGCDGVTYQSIDFLTTPPDGHYAIVNYVVIDGWGSASFNP